MIEQIVTRKAAAMKLILSWLGLMLFLVIISGGLRMTLGEFLLMAGGTLLFFVIVAQVIEWPEKGIRWLIARWKARRKTAEPHAPPEPKRWHNGFDDVV